jgi:ribosome-associated protein
MDIRKLQRAIVDGLEDVKAQQIVVFNTEALSPLFERVIIASGTSNRQTKALASSVRDSVKQAGLQVLRTEGEENGEWIIVDCGAAVAHIMQPSIRDYYHLEEIWGGKPVSMKLASQDGKLVKASADDAPARKAPAAKSPAGGAYAGRAPRRTAEQRPAPAPARAPTRASDQEGPARKTPGTKAAASKTASAKAPASKSPARKTTPSATKSPVRRAAPAGGAGVAAKKAPARKAPAAKKAAPRKTPARG